MLTILPPDQGSPAAFGSSLGTGLGQGLQMLAQKKLQDALQARKKSESLSGLKSLGFDADQAEQLSGLDPFIQREIIKQKLAAPQQQAYAQALSSLLGGQEMGQAPQQATEEQMIYF